MKKLKEINDKVIVNCHNGMSFTEALEKARDVKEEVKDDTNN
jgi:hypothetical protein